MKHHISRIRQSNNDIKQRWLIGLSAAATIIVVMVWVMYMRAFIFTGSTQNAQEDVRIGFWPVFKNGLTITRSSISRSFDTILWKIPKIGGTTTIIQNPN